MKKFILLMMLLSSTWTSLSLAATTAQPLPIDKAFNFSAQVTDHDTVQVNWKIAPGYYLYRDRISYKVMIPETGEIAPVLLPPGQLKEDAVLGDYEVYSNQFTLDLPIKNVSNQEVTLWVCYQGCSENGFCYPPETKQVTLDLATVSSQAIAGISVDADSKNVLSQTTTKIARQDKISALLNEGNFAIILLSFFGFGLLLTFTPCVLPMIPILSGIIIGHGHDISSKKAFALSLAYVLGMAITYALAGFLVGFVGGSVQAALQIPWVIALFSLIFVLLALSLFGFYELQVPAKWQNKITLLSNQQKRGSYLGVAVMGCLSSLIVSPCVSAPLVGALAYISNTGNSILGGSALFAMGLGMGVPLLIIGTSGGKLLPKAGPWMNNVKSFFGVVMLAVAIWMLSRIIPAQITLLLWAALLIISAVYMGILQPKTHSKWAHFWQGIGLILAVYGVLLMIGAAMGNTNPLQPLQRQPVFSYAENTATMPVKTMEQLFTRVKSNDDFDLALEQASHENKPVMLDFYADWCIACKEMEHTTFANPEIQQLLNHFVVLQADVTANDKVDKALEERLRVIAPPTILFFDRQGNELTGYRIVGEMGPEEFAKHLEEALQETNQ